MTDAKTLQHLKQIFSDKSKRFDFFIYYCRKEIFLQCCRAREPLLGLLWVSFAACQDLPADACQKTRKLALPMSIWDEVYFLKVVGLQTTAYFKWNSTHAIGRNLPKLMIAALKDKKASVMIWKKIYISNNCNRII